LQIEHILDFVMVIAFLVLVSEWGNVLLRSTPHSCYFRLKQK